MKTFNQFIIEHDTEFNGSHTIGEDDFFEFEGQKYSIRKAEEIVKGRKKTGETLVKKWFDKFIKTGRITLNVRKPGEVDLREPLLMGTLEVNGKENGLPIDGWHRIALANDEGVK